MTLHRFNPVRSFRATQASFIAAIVSVALLTISCATQKPNEVVGRQSSQVFMLPQEGGMASETLELKGGQFRYWFSSDTFFPNRSRQKYPVEGNYEFKGDQLILSSGKTFTVRSLNGNQTLWRTEALDSWEHQHIIDGYGILLRVESIKSGKPVLKPMFTKEEWARSAEQVRKLEQKK